MNGEHPQDADRKVRGPSAAHRGGIAVVAGTLSLGLGLGLRVMSVDLGARWVMLVGLAASATALLAAWYARPRGALLTTWGAWPGAAALAVAMSVLAWMEPSLAAALAPAGPATAGGVGLLTGLVHLRQRRLTAALMTPMLSRDELVDVRAAERTRRVRIAELRRGDEVSLTPGDDVPVDGVVIEGTGFVDERALTAEALPRTVKPGDHVLAGSVSSVPGLVVRVTAPLARSVFVRTQDLAQQVAFRSLTMSASRRWGSAALVALALSIAAAVAVTAGFDALDLWMPSAAGVLLAMVTAAPAMAWSAHRIATLDEARRRGVVLARVKDVDALGHVERWQIDPSLVAAPGHVEVIPLGRIDCDEALAVAQALLQDHRSPESLSVAAQVRQRQIDVPESAALRRTQALFHGTVVHQRWVMGPSAAVEADCGVEVPAGALAHLAALRTRGAIAWVLAQPSQGAMAVIGIEIAADASAGAAGQALDASLMPGLLDTTTKALAQAAGLKSHGPPLRARDGALVARASARPSDGLCVVVQDATPEVEVRAGGAPRLFTPGLEGFPRLVAYAAAGARRSRRRAVIAAVMPLVVAAALAGQGWLLPEVGALVGAVTLASLGGLGPSGPDAD